MNTKTARNPDKLRAWESASRIERAPQPEKKATPGATRASAVKSKEWKTSL